MRLDAVVQLVKDVEALLNTPNYARLRFGIGQEVRRYDQIDFVLGAWDDEEKKSLAERIEKASKMALSFTTAGLQNTMNNFNGT